MNVHFSKYHGAGNDFILIDGRTIDTSGLGTKIIRHLCHRRYGIGADGLIILLPGIKNDFRMVYFNSNGEEGTMCGNGGRCITAFAHKLGVIGLETIFEGIDGLHEATILQDNQIRIKLMDVKGIKKYEDGYFLDTGSPHFVKFVPDTDETDVFTNGRAIRQEARFQPGGVNVNFVQLLPGTNHIKVRTYERGVEDETLSCGTGVTAAAIASSHHQNTDFSSYHIEAPGGKLIVSFKADQGLHFSEVFLTGPAMHVYDGDWSL